MRTVPVNQSAGPLLEGCEPLLLISIFNAFHCLLFGFSVDVIAHNLDSCVPFGATAQFRSRTAITAAHSTTSVLTRYTAPRSAPLATKPSAGLASPSDRSRK